MTRLVEIKLHTSCHWFYDFPVPMPGIDTNERILSASQRKLEMCGGDYFSEPKLIIL